ncbi:MAG: PDZ domain-containing protein [Planctomycetota bacterium]
MKRLFVPFVLLAVSFGSLTFRAAAQEKAPQLTLDPAWVNQFAWRCVGPAVMGGRISAISVYEKDPSIYYVATASGGLLKTINNGMTFEHQFDHENTVSIGDVCVFQGNPDIVWVGTGESKPRNSVSYGDGVYKSSDGGKTWEHKGLKGAFQIGRIVIHPQNPDVVYAGALGRLYGPNDERGLYKTTDGGATWERILFVDDKTGVVDVAMHPANPETLLVATYERERDGFDSNDPAKKLGPGSGLYRTTDGGKSFEKLTNGLPTCQLGRIGICFSRQNPDTAFIVLESERIGQLSENAAYAGVNGEDAETGAKLTEIVENGPAAKVGLKVGDIILAVNDVIVLSYTKFVEELRQHEPGEVVKLKVARGKELLEIELTLDKQPAEQPRERRGEGGPGRERGGAEASGREREGEVAQARERKGEEAQQRGRRGEEFGRGARAPFSSGLGGQRENIHRQQGKEGYEHGGIYKSSDGGLSWSRINSVNPRPMYFSRIVVDPSDENNIYVCGISLYRSKDGGVTFTGDAGGSAHPDHHALWVDPRDGRHLLLGNDGGLYVTYDRCEHWEHLDNMAIGQFYHAEISPRRDYWVYGGLQDNGSWGGPARGVDGGGAINQDWVSVGGGDGFVVKVDPHDPDLVYSESQGGSIGRINLRTDERGSVRPPRAPRGTSYRFNWNTPFILSQHNSGIFYTAGNLVFRSLWRGEEMRTLSPEITLTDRGSATALAESPLDPNVLYVGTDDGALWVTKNGGHEWTDLAPWPKPAPEEKAAPEEPESSQGEPATLTARSGPWVAELSAAGLQDAPAASQEAPAGDPVTGEWEGRVITDFDIGRAGEFTLELKLVEGKLSGIVRSEMGDSRVTGGSFDSKTGEIKFTTQSEQGEASIKAVIKDDKMTGELSFMGGEFSMEFEAKRVKSTEPAGEAAPAAAQEPAAGAPEAKEAVKEEQAPSEPGEKSLVKLLPGPRWVASIEASRFKEGRVYLCLDAHRSNDDNPYLFISEDFGQSWESITGNLPWGSTRVLREDRENENILYAGTEFGAWVSVNRGKDWTRLTGGLPTVAVQGFAQHRTCGDVVAATHGRSLWIFDATTLRQITPEVLAAGVHLFKPANAVLWGYRPRRGGWGGGTEFRGATPPDGAEIYYLLKEKPREVTLEVKDLEGKVLRKLEPSLEAGLQRVTWDLREERRAAPPGGRGRGEFRRGFGGRPRISAGKYVIELTVEGKSFKQYLIIEEEPKDLPVAS